VAGGLPSGSSVGNPRVAISPSNPQVVYASFDNPSNSNAAGIWKSADGGATWSQPGTVPNYMGGQGWYDTTLIVDPTNSNIAYAGGQTSFIQTTDGGAHWTDISTGATGNNGPHADHHAIGFDANGHLLDGDDGGVWRLDNATPGSILWTDLNSNLQITQFIAVLVYRGVHAFKIKSFGVRVGHFERDCFEWPELGNDFEDHRHNTRA